MNANHPGKANVSILVHDFADYFCAHIVIDSEILELIMWLSFHLFNLLVN